MIRSTALATLVAAPLLTLGAIGCEMGSGRQTSGPEAQTPTLDQRVAERAQLAAFAGGQSYPDNLSATDDQPIAVVLSRDGRSIRIFNFTNQPLRDANVWVNRTFVRRVEAVPPRGSVTIPATEFYDKTGRDLSSQDIRIATVQVHAEGKLHNTLGPVSE